MNILTKKVLSLGPLIWFCRSFHPQLVILLLSRDLSMDKCSVSQYVFLSDYQDEKYLCILVENVAMCGVSILCRFQPECPRVQTLLVPVLHACKCDHIDFAQLTNHLPSWWICCPSFISRIQSYSMWGFLRMKLPFMDHRNSQHVVVVLGWIFSCNEQSAVSVTCWGDQTSFIPRANKPHRLCCQKHHPFNRDKSERGQPAYCHTASTALQSLASRHGGGAG